MEDLILHVTKELSDLSLEAAGHGVNKVQLVFDFLGELHHAIIDKPKVRLEVELGILSTFSFPRMLQIQFTANGLSKILMRNQVSQTCGSISDRIFHSESIHIHDIDFKLKKEKRCRK